MKCPYCNSEKWNYNIHKKSEIIPLCDDYACNHSFFKGYNEYSFAYCPDCNKEFVVRDEYRPVELDIIMTMEEFKKKKEEYEKQ